MVFFELNILVMILKNHLCFFIKNFFLKSLHQLYYLIIIAPTTLIYDVKKKIKSYKIIILSIDITNSSIFDFLVIANVYRKY